MIHFFCVNETVLHGCYEPRPREKGNSLEVKRTGKDQDDMTVHLDQV